uniref:Reverse transcriptase Ty1/copia-type domain-containing protein n=1 Tax=Fagus sylvatica TaxID=28930 RepID=A0A2N9HHI0_FAGSY
MKFNRMTQSYRCHRMVAQYQPALAIALSVSCSLRLFWHSSAASTISGIAPPPPSEFRCARCRQRLNNRQRLTAFVGTSSPGFQSKHLHHHWKDLSKTISAAQKSPPSDAGRAATRRSKFLPAVTPRHAPHAPGSFLSQSKGSSEDENAFRIRLIEWDSNNHQILTWLRNTSIPSISNLLGNFDDARTAWDMLAKRYSSSHGTREYQLSIEQYQIRQDPGQSINDFFARFQFIWDQLDLSDPPWDTPNDAMKYATRRDQMRLYQFLMALHDDYEPVRGQLLHQLPTPSLDAALNDLVREETRLQTLQAQNKLNVLATTSPLAPLPQSDSDQFSPNTRRSDRKSNKFCRYCKKHGHTIETCFRRNRSTAAVTHGDTDQTPPAAVAPAHSGSAITLTTDQLEDIIAQALVRAGNASSSSALSVLPGKFSSWLLDSACCNHMTPYPSFFSHTSSARHAPTIHTANGSTMLDPRTGQELGTGRRIGRLFEISSLRLPATGVSAATSSSPSLSLWHSRLGHASSSRAPLSKMEEPKENFDTSLTQFVLSSYLPKFLYPFGEKLSSLLPMPSIVFQVQPFLIRPLMSAFLDLHPTISISDPLALLVSSFFSLMNTTNSSLVLAFVAFLVMVKLKKDIDVMILLLIAFASPVMLSFGNIVCSLRVVSSPLQQCLPPFHRLSHLTTLLAHPLKRRLILRLNPQAPAPSEDPAPATTLRRSSRVTTLPSHLRDFHCYTALATLHEPHSYREASSNPLWQAAMAEELDALSRTRTWDLVDLPPEKSVVGCKWVFKIKTRSDGSIERYKARLVAKGFTQEYGIDYEETFAPVARLSSVRTLLAVAASRQWQAISDGCQKCIPQWRLEHLELGLLSLALQFLDWGLEITSSDDGFYLTQAKYTSDLLSRAGLTDHKILDTPIEFNARLTPSSGELLPDPTLYRQLVGSLVYLTVTRPDISYAVHQVSQFMSAPRSTHYAAVLRILRYLKGTLFHGLHFSAQSPLTLRAYSDADWAGDPTDRRSTTGYCFLLGSSLISWRSKKQSVVARSSTEAEYRALADTTSELLWLRWLLQDLGVSTSSATPIYCDNRSAIQIARNDVFHERTKHIEIDCHLVRHHLLQGSLQLVSVSSHDQLADIFTKSHPTGRFRDLVSKLQLVSHPPP